MNVDEATLEAVKATIVKTLGIDDRATSLTATTPLFGSMPELDSLAVLQLATSLEKQFSFEIDGSEFTGEIFETIGSLAEFVQAKTSPR